MLCEYVFDQIKCNFWHRNGTILALIIIIWHKCVYIFIQQLTSLPVYGFSKVGPSLVQQIWSEIAKGQKYTIRCQQFQQKIRINNNSIMHSIAKKSLFNKNDIPTFFRTGQQVGHEYFSRV